MQLNRRLLFTVLVVAAAAAELVGNAAAAIYVVGDSLGWTTPTNDPAAYSNWASRHTFSVGDVLVFSFTTGVHDVAEVTKGAFDGCTSTNPIKLVTTGPANITLNSTGPNYYICTFRGHCSSGQKLAINVSAASPPPPTGSLSPPPPTGGLSPPPPPSSATIASFGGPLVIFASAAFGLMI